MIQRLRTLLQQRHDERGATLVEMTVVIALMGILIPLITGLIYSSTKAQNTVLSSANGQIQESTIVDSLTEDVSRAQWVAYEPHSNNFYNYIALQKTSGECVAWQVSPGGQLRRVIYPSRNGPTNFTSGWIDIAPIKLRGTEQYFTVDEADGTVQYNFDIELQDRVREVSGSITPQIGQNVGSARNVCFR